MSDHFRTLKTSPGIVIIARNEGEKLKQCLLSVAEYSPHIVYVDSGSTDGSPDLAKTMGAQVISLDLTLPFTAARARNTGCQHLKEQYPESVYVQFIDGDCILDPDWLPKACAFLDEHPECAAVCGRRREMYPDSSIYNELCDAEWDTPIGETQACGGDVLIRMKAFEEVGGYRTNLIAGEEPELCLRLREKAWTIWRLEAEMTRHDAAMTRFSQWWKRVMRGGHAFAEVYHLHRHSPKMIWKRELLRALLWGAGLPAIILLLTLFHKSFLLLGLIYPLQVTRLGLKSNLDQKNKWTHALFLVVAKFAETQGIIRFHLFRLFNKQSKLIEYKSGSGKEMKNSQ